MIRRCGVYVSSSNPTAVLAVGSTYLGYTPNISGYWAANAPNYLTSSYPFSGYVNEGFPGGTFWMAGVPTQWTGNATGDGAPAGYPSDTYPDTAILSGTYDSDIESHASYLAGLTASGGGGMAIVRPGWEFNGNWYCWGTTYRTPANTISVFQHFATIYHSYGVKVCWNPVCLPGSNNPSFDVQSAWPGAYNPSSNTGGADFIGMDIYDQGSGTPTMPALWNNFVNQGPGYQGGISGVTEQSPTYYAAMAAATGCPLIVCELGLTAPGASPPGLSDSLPNNYAALWIEALGNWCADNGVVLTMLWCANTGANLFYEDYPNADAQAQITFGAPSVPTPQPFVGCYDTMKSSRDTMSYDASVVTNLKALNPTHLTICTSYDYPTLQGQWVSGIRAAGKKVWWRCMWNQWQDLWGSTGILMPFPYIQQLLGWLQANGTTLLAAGDIFDFCPEPNNGLYWASQYGADWSTVNAAVNEYNGFIQMAISMVKGWLSQNGLGPDGPNGVETRVNSQSSYAATTPAFLFPSTTLENFISADLYPDAGLTSPSAATAALMAQIASVKAAFPSLIFNLAEHGYDSSTVCNDALQNSVLEAEYLGAGGILATYGSVEDLNMCNYFCGPCDLSNPGLANILEGTTDAWTPRSGAAQISTFYEEMQTPIWHFVTPTGGGALLCVPT